MFNFLHLSPLEWIFPYMNTVISRFLSACFIILFCCFSHVIVAEDRFTIEQVSNALHAPSLEGKFPEYLKFDQFGYAEVDYTLDAGLHDEIAKIYRRYSPDYASFVAIDPDTGAILSLSSYMREEDWSHNLALGATYPAASVFKIVSAAAALDTKQMTLDSVIPFNGKSTTLYKRQILKHKDNKYTRRPTFKKAFAKSSNPVFGRVGIEKIGRDGMMNYAGQFGFGKNVVQDLPVQPSQFNLPLEEEWELAEAASGFTRDILLGPIHAAAFAASILNGGEMYAPYVVNKIHDKNGSILYNSKPQVLGSTVNSSTAKDLLAMMRETVRTGSARKAFRKASRYSAYRDADFGGKTGSLTGYSPHGRYDWFVGFGERHGKRIAYASLIINKEKWYVRSSQVAFEVLNYYFKRSSEKDS